MKICSLVNLSTVLQSNHANLSVSPSRRFWSAAVEASRAGCEVEGVARRALPVYCSLPPPRRYRRRVMIERKLSVPLATLAAAVRVSASFAAAPSSFATNPSTFSPVRLPAEAGAFAAFAALTFHHARHGV